MTTGQLRPIEPTALHVASRAGASCRPIGGGRKRPDRQGDPAAWHTAPADANAHAVATRQAAVWDQGKRQHGPRYAGGEH